MNPISSVYMHQYTNFNSTHFLFVYVYQSILICYINLSIYSYTPSTWIYLLAYFFRFTYLYNYIFNCQYLFISFRNLIEFICLAICLSVSVSVHLYFYLQLVTFYRLMLLFFLRRGQK